MISSNTLRFSWFFASALTILCSSSSESSDFTNDLNKVNFMKEQYYEVSSLYGKDHRNTKNFKTKMDQHITRVIFYNTGIYPNYKADATELIDFELKNLENLFLDEKDLNGRTSDDQKILNEWKKRFDKSIETSNSNRILNIKIKEGVDVVADQVHALTRRFILTSIAFYNDMISIHKQMREDYPCNRPAMARINPILIKAL
jgi:hypothetical protein